MAPGAGALANFRDEDYTAAGASLSADPFKADIILKVSHSTRSLITTAQKPADRSQVRPPNVESEIASMSPGSTVISFLYPSINTTTTAALQSSNITSFAMDCIPRISRAQTFDALSSMANTAGYRAILEAANSFGRFLTGQVTAAGKIPPGKVMVVGAGVAGLSAITTAKRMGAVVRGFDTRKAAKEQVESLGAEFLTVEIEEDGSGAGGYGKEMSKVSLVRAQRGQLSFGSSPIRVSRGSRQHLNRGNKGEPAIVNDPNFNSPQ